MRKPHTIDLTIEVIFKLIKIKYFLKKLVNRLTGSPGPISFIYLSHVNVDEVIKVCVL